MNIKSALVAVLFLCSSSMFGEHADTFFLIVSGSYNNEMWCTMNMDSVFDQSYKNWHWIYVNDASTDATGEVVEQYAKERGFQDKMTIVHNHERMGGLYNQYNAIHSWVNEDAVVVILDADDFLADPDVLAHLNSVYKQGDIWLTYGQFQEWPSGRRGWCGPMPDRIVNNNAFRQWQNIPAHLRTFKVWLFKRIKLQDLQIDGQFIPMSYDIAAMFPMIEMASKGHFQFIPRVMLKYNGKNPINNHKKSKKLQRSIDLHLRSKTPYTPLRSKNG